MLTPAQAIDEIRSRMPQFGSEDVPLAAAAGRILRQAVFAERDQPPFDRVMMDGIALRFDALDRGQREFRIQATQHAGDPVQTLDDDGNCIEIMTGAVMPIGADCVVPVERIQVDRNKVTVASDYRAERRQFIHPRGSDLRQGQQILGEGISVTPLEVAIIASCGLERVAVSSRPVIRIVSTGNELVPPGEPVEPHQIRLSNGPAVVAMLAGQGFTDSAHDHIPDDPQQMRTILGQHLETADVLILSGGVSMGKADFVPQALAELGVRQVFHRISQRPGKPMWFGIGSRRQAVFALPGNPVSTLVCCRHYVLPALFEASGRIAPQPGFAILSDEFRFEPDLTCFLPVRIMNRGDGALLAEPAPTNTSGDFVALSGTDGYVELASGQQIFPAHSVVPLHLWDRP